MREINYIMGFARQCKEAMNLVAVREMVERTWRGKRGEGRGEGRGERRDEGEGLSGMKGKEGRGGRRECRGEGRRGMREKGRRNMEEGVRGEVRG